MKKLSTIIRQSFPQKGIPQEISSWRMANMPNIFRGLKKVTINRMLGLSTNEGFLYLNILRPAMPEHIIKELLGEYIDQCAYGISFPHWAGKKGIFFDPINLGLASTRVVTTVGVGYLVDAMQNIVEPEDQKYHGIGTGATAENIADTDIETELTTEYIADNTRATGSTTEGASANIYRTVGTNTVDAIAAITEHGILSSATVGAGVLLDRSVFTVINLGSGDSLQSTYDLTKTAGG